MSNPPIERFALDLEQFFVDGHGDGVEVFIHLHCRFCLWDSPGQLGEFLAVLAVDAMEHAVTCNRIPLEVGVTFAEIKAGNP